jgi:multimeric flavodoxin WrbA
MKVVAFNGSPRKEGNTYLLIKKVLEELEKEGIDTEIIHIGGQLLRGCTACVKCRELRNKKCIFDDDNMNQYIKEMDEADGIILASPTYFANVSTEMKALIDRAGYVLRGNGNLLKRKVGAGIVAVRRAGSMNAFDAMNHFFLINQMIVPGSSYWNMGYGRAIGEVENDEEGINIMKTLGQNMAWLLKKIN